MDDLCSLWATYSSMCHICGDPTISHRLALDRFRCGRTWDDPIDYEALLASLTQVGNPEACFLTRIQTVFKEKHSPWPCLNNFTHTADGRHNLAAYLVALFIYRHNGDAGDDDTTRRYIRRVEGEEVSWVAMAGGRGGGPTSRWLSNKGCVLCLLATKVVLHETSCRCHRRHRCAVIFRE